MSAEVFASEPVHKPKLAGVIVRVVIIAVMTAVLFMGIGLFCGIVAYGVANAANGGGFNMALAYRHVAFPIAATAASLGLLAGLVFETRHYRRRKQAWREAKNRY